MIRLLKGMVALVLVFALATTAYLFTSWQSDNAEITAYFSSSFSGDVVRASDVDALMSQVYFKEGFGNSGAYFFLQRLGPTPHQVMQLGGDCSEKSRLVATVLKERGVDATLVMLASCDGCEFGHTVVEANTVDGPIVVDPVYNMSFPKGDGSYYSVLELRADPSLLPGRLEELIAERGEEDKIAFYRAGADGVHYGAPKTINLEKNGVLRGVKQLISMFSDEPQLVYRPRILEDPKLFLLTASTGTSLFFLTLYLLLRWLDRRR
ncbi:MAG: hypothetical protein ACI9NT_001282 [Bacteroidia bacterium]|jgi:hypothetical protein